MQVQFYKIGLFYAKTRAYAPETLYLALQTSEIAHLWNTSE